MPGGAPKGNKNATKSKLLTTALRHIIITNPQLAGEIAQKLIATAKAGEAWAMQLLYDRVDGKQAQSIDLTADLTSRTVRELSNEELAIIAAGGSIGDSGETPGPDEPTGIH